MKLNIIYFLIISFFFAGCVKNYVEPVVIPDEQVVSFASDIVPIFTDACISCHVNGGQFSGLKLTSDVAYDQLWTDGIGAPYIDTANAAMSKLYLKLTSNMPPSGQLENEKLSLVLKWIEEGAKNN